MNQTHVYPIIARGSRVNEPAADLAIASAAFDRPTSPGIVYFGEVGLSGEVRQVAHGNRKLAAPEGLRLDEIGHITDLVAKFTPESASKA